MPIRAVRMRSHQMHRLMYRAVAWAWPFQPQVDEEFEETWNLEHKVMNGVMFTIIWHTYLTALDYWGDFPQLMTGLTHTLLYQGLASLFFPYLTRSILDRDLSHLDDREYLLILAAVFLLTVILDVLSKQVLDFYLGCPPIFREHDLYKAWEEFPPWQKWRKLRNY